MTSLSFIISYFTTIFHDLILHDLSSGMWCTDLGTIVSDTRVSAHTFMHTRD